MQTDLQTIQRVKDYYGRVLKTRHDLQTSACCCTEPAPPHVRRVHALLDEQLLKTSYGCGTPIPMALEGCSVLDLGCGSGKDAFTVSKLVGPGGRVTGIDMLEAQIQTARRHVEPQMKRFGFDRPNVEFRQGYMEYLRDAGIDDDSVDVVISNCVINLSPDKRRVFSEILRVLKPGGELLFSDVFADRRVPVRLMQDPVLLGECLAGALYVEDFRRLLMDLGCPDYRTVARCAIALDNPLVTAKTGLVQFYSMTVRLFKLTSLEDICEDYGQTATYLGTLAETPHRFALDRYHCFDAGKPLLVCGNTASMLQETRYGRFFDITGDRSTHFGPFPCGSPPDDSGQPDGCPGSTCC